METQFLLRVASLFLGWNMHKPKKLIYELDAAISQANWNHAIEIINLLEHYMADFEQGDDEGKFIYSCWEHLKLKISEQPRQISLF